MEKHNLQLTALETKVMEAYIDGLYAEPGFSDIDAKDLSNETGISTRTIRGVISSLVQKGIINIQETDNYAIVRGRMKQIPGFQIIYLNPSHWYLHPEWKSEYDSEKYGVIA